MIRKDDHCIGNVETNIFKIPTRVSRVAISPGELVCVSTFVRPTFLWDFQLFSRRSITDMTASDIHTYVYSRESFNCEDTGIEFRHCCGEKAALSAQKLHRVWFSPASFTQSIRTKIYITKHTKFHYSESFWLSTIVIQCLTISLLCTVLRAFYEILLIEHCLLKIFHEWF